MEFFKKQTRIDFMQIRRTTALISIVLFVLAIGTLSVRGLNWGLDFTGGVVVELGFKKPVPIDELRLSFQQGGFKDPTLQAYGSSQDILVRLAPEKNQPQDKKIAVIVQKLAERVMKPVEVKRVDIVGPQVGKELTEKGALAVLVALALTMLYIMLRFEHRFAIGAAVALAHDPILILGIFSLFQVEFDLPTLAAMLAVIGYSLNDTIVVFDRVKENFIKVRKRTPIEIMNLSINQTLSRTLMTSGLTLLVVIALLFYGGPSIFGFSLALFIGIVVGTYSSIYISGALACALGLSRQDLLPREATDVSV